MFCVILYGIKEEMGNRYFVRKQAEHDKDHAGEQCNSHRDGVGDGNFGLVQCKGECYEKTEEHSK